MVVAKAGVADSLCAKLDAAAASLSRGKSITEAYAACSSRSRACSSSHPKAGRLRRGDVTLRWTLRLLTAGALVAIAACSSPSAQPERTDRPNELQVIEPAGKEASWTYAPALLRVSKGTVVTIVNRGREFHTVTSNDPGRPFDISIDTNKTVTFTFDKVGTFAYHCGVHPQMTGVIQVCDGACG